MLAFVGVVEREVKSKLGRPWIAEPYVGVVNADYKSELLDNIPWRRVVLFGSLCPPLDHFEVVEDHVSHKECRRA